MIQKGETGVLGEKNYRVWEVGEWKCMEQ